MAMSTGLSTVISTGISKAFYFYLCYGIFAALAVAIQNT